MHIDMHYFDGLEPHVGQHVIWDTLAALAPPGEDTPAETETRYRAVAEMLESLRPGTPYEAMLAAQIVAAHHGSMGCHRWSMQADPASAGAARLRRDAMAMTRTMLAAEAALARTQDRRAKAAGREDRGDGVDGGAAPAWRQNPMHREDAGPRHGAAAEVGKHPMHRGDADPRKEAAAAVGQDPMHREDADPRHDAAAAVGQNPMHRENTDPRHEAATEVGQHPMHREDAGPRHDTAAAAGQNPMHRGDAVAPPAAPPLDLHPRERGKPDFSTTAATIQALAVRDPRTLTDDELETLGRARATPDKPYDASWRVLKPLPPIPRWEDLTPEQRRERYGYRTPEEIEADRAARERPVGDT